MPRKGVINNPNHMANLTPIKPGQTLNPNGRPKIPKLKDVLESALGGDPEKIKATLDKIISVIADQAKRGDLKAAEMLMNRVYGGHSQHIKVEDETKNPRPIIVRTSADVENLAKLEEL
jgi:hypothetical protein